MVASKTRIWRGGLSEIMRSSEQPRGVARAANAAEELDRGTPADDQSVPVQAVPQPSSPKSARSSRGTLVGHVVDLTVLDAAPRSKAMSTTRLVPIESLLATAPTAVSASSAPQHPEAANRALEPSEQAGIKAFLPRRFPQLSLDHVRRGVMVLLALFALAAWLRGSGPSETAERPLRKAVLAAQAATKSKGAADDAPVSEALASSTQRALVGTLHERSAVDALASGDYVAAQRLYTELAAQVEGRSAYSEAARILRERLQSKSSER